MLATFTSIKKLTSPPLQKLNGSILIECKTLRHVVTSSSEAEVGGIFHNVQTLLPIRAILEALDHTQPPTPVKTDNTTAKGFVYNNIVLKKSKSWDMRYHWLRDRENQKHIHVYWDKGNNNDANYFTKHFPANEHREQRNRYVQDRLAHMYSSVLNMCLSITSSARVC